MMMQVIIKHMIILMMMMMMMMMNTVIIWTQGRIPTPPGKSWFFFPKIYRTWKVLENEFGPG